MHASPSCSRYATPEPFCISELDHFDWSQLNTLPSKVKPPRRKPEQAIQLKCSKKLRDVQEARDISDGLAKLVQGTRGIIGQKWKIFNLYFARDEDYPNCVRLWSKVEWRKWDVVEFLTAICCKYYKEVQQARSDDVVLCIQSVDEEYLALVIHILELGMGDERVIAIKEWERPGTKLTTESRSLLSVDLAEHDEDGDPEDETEVPAFDLMEVDEQVPVERAERERYE